MICSRCIYDGDIPNIKFDKDGVCNYCQQVDELSEEYGVGQKKGIDKLNSIIKKIKIDGKRLKYDCIIGVSGGTDSSYILLKACEWGLRPLAVHYDNTWNTAIASENIRKITSNLDVDLHTHVVNNKEHDAIKLAYLRAGVQEFDTDTDLAFVQVLRSVAAKYKIKYILEGHSFVAEGISPASANYFDGGYIKDIVNRFGETTIKTYPLMTFFQFMKWVLVYRQKFIRPLWYMDYSKEKAQKILSESTGWKYYGGHHLENRASSFAHSVWIPQKFGTDYRILTLAADVRNGNMTRGDALNEYSKPIEVDKGLIDYVCKRLSLSEDKFDELMNGRVRTWRDFKTYKTYFEVLGPLFNILSKHNFVPRSFYLKYCFPIEEKK